MTDVTPRREQDAGALIDLRLIFPPQWSPFQPFLSTPSLVSYLRGEGFRVEQHDWNVEFYHYFISAQRLNTAKERLARYVRRLGADDWGYLSSCVYSLALLEDYYPIRERIGTLKHKATFADISKCRSSVEALDDLLFAFSTAEPVVTLKSWTLDIGDTLASISSLDHFTTNAGENPFVEFFEQKLSTIAAPRYFGLSIIGTEQIVPGLTLAAAIRRAFPTVPIVVGGSVFSRLVEKADSGTSQLFGRYFDFICRYEGEAPMAQFLAAEKPNKENIANIVYLQDGKVRANELALPVNLENIPTPDFSGLPLNEYFSPEPVLPILATRGCYWGKCAFCYHGMIYQERYRMRSVENIAKDIESLSHKHNARHFTFHDEALPPKLFRYLPDVLPKGKYYFTGLYKFEKFFNAEDYRRMYDIGFRSFYIGLETASERLQAHMRKNNKQATMLSNLKNASDAGIWNHTFNFFGFPTETSSEALETAKFLVEHSDIIDSEGTGVFSFEHNAPIFHDPVAFGVTNVQLKERGILNLYYAYDVEAGLDSEGAAMALEAFTKLKAEKAVFQDSSWIPREFLLLLLSYHDKRKLKAHLSADRKNDSAAPPSFVKVRLVSPNHEEVAFLVDLSKRRIAKISDGEAAWGGALGMQPAANVPQYANTPQKASAAV
jgi:radical SAM superfamily enzyme YgiQ (UPF0313 family)